MLKPLSARRPPGFDPRQLVLGGVATEGEGEPFDVTFPVTGERLVTLRAASGAQVDRAVTEARAAFDDGPWPRMGSSERAAVLDATADVLAARMDELVEVILFDNGKTRREAQIDVFAAIGSCRRSAQHARDDAPIELPAEGGLEKTVVREPVGVVAGIAPFNAPLMFAGLKAAPALAAGNTVVLKPSERAPLLARAFCDAAREAGVPPGAIGLVHGDASVAAALCGHRGVDMITITGGSRAGSAVMRAAAPTIKNLLLELGGKSAHIVLADADLDAAIPAVAAGIFRNAGQRCFSGSRLVVEEAVADRVEEEIKVIAEAIRIGDPFDDTTQAGPLIDGRAVADAEAFVARALEDPGVQLACGGGRIEALAPGSFFAPTLLVGATADAFAAQEEVFGPVLTSIRVPDAEAAVRVANHSRYGLAGGVWGRDVDRARRIAARVRTGYMWVNTYAAVAGDVPFGGYGHSGLGREAGVWGYEAYTELKSILVDTTGGSTAPLFEGSSG